jgi:uncharacterized repeat protein (TIGR01451 family)
VILRPVTSGGIGTGLLIRATGFELAGIEIRQFLNQGISVDNAADVQIGLPTSSTSNVVSVLNGIGLLVSGSSATGLRVESSYFGVRDSGVCEGNRLAGISLTGGVSGAQIGTDAGENTIGCNGTQGITITSSNNNTIHNNHIGRRTDSGGVFPVANQDSGISVSNSSGTTITSNIISSNRAHGINLSTANNTTIRNNQIGLPNAFPVTSSGNVSSGIRSALSSDVQISSNQIANNGGDGIFVPSGSRVAIIGNSLTANNALGVDLGANGVNANDAGDADSGANALQNYPLLTNAASDGSQLLLEGSFPAAGGTYDLQIYENSACDASGFGEGATLRLTASGISGGTLTLTEAGVFTSGTFLTILAVDRSGGATEGNTSEFSNCIAVTDVLSAAFSATPLTVAPGQTVTFSNLSTGFITGYSWDFGDATSAATRDTSHAYSVPGSYTVTLIISGAGGASDSTTLQINVVAPTATPQRTNTPIPPSAVPVTASSTPIPPTSTSTPVPPTSTNTPIPPSATSTPRPPTSTSTPLPPSATATLLPTLTATTPPTLTAIPSATLTPLPPEIEVTKTSDGDTTVQIDIVNSGSGAAEDVVLVETLREEVRYVSSFASAPSCLESGGIVVCELGTIPPGETSSVGINVQSSGVDPASGQTVVTVGGVPGAVVNEPYIIKIGEPPVAGPGAEITYTIRVINATAESALNLRVVDQMPDAIEILEGSASAGTLTIDGQDVLLELDELQAGARLTIVLRTRVREDGSFTQIINEACLSSSSNASPRCAVMSFLRAGQLPGTGEAPLIALLVRAGLVALGLASTALIAWRIWRRRV